MKTGRYKEFEIDSKLDKDGDVKLIINENDKFTYHYINKKHAKEIIKHLTKVFKLEEELTLF